MGVKIYYYMVLAVLGFAFFLPQHGKQKKYYVMLMAVLHTFVCGWRYMYLHGDLRKYAWTYYTITESGWFSEEVFNGGRNFGFFWLQKLFSHITNGDFQIFLIFLAIVTEVAVAVIIYRYSPSPWLSYLLWNCFGFYILGFALIKQALAMAVLMGSFDAIMREKPTRFIAFTALAGCIHAPALIFLPAYWLVKNRLSGKRIFLYGIAVMLIFLFRNPIVTFVSQFYYEETDYMVSTSVGGRFWMVAALLLVGIALRGINGKNFTKLFNLMVVAAILQMFSGFDNVFTRLTDYYFQFLILYLPMVFYPEKDRAFEHSSPSQRIKLNPSQKVAALLCVVMLSCLFYYKTNLSTKIEVDTDNYLNYRFCWEVKDQ